MANRTRAFAFYFGGKKVADASGGSSDFQAGREATVTTEGIVVSQGRPHGSASIETVQMVAGQSVDLIGKFLSGEVFQVAYEVSGKILMVDAVLNGMSHKMDPSRGMTTGSYNLVLLEPTAQ